MGVLFMQDELIIYSNISNKKYVEEMILEGLHVEKGFGRNHH